MQTCSLDPAVQCAIMHGIYTIAYLSSLQKRSLQHNFAVINVLQAPIAVYTSGKGSSAAGLTATVIKDAGGEFYLEVGCALC